MHIPDTPEALLRAIDQQDDRVLTWRHPRFPEFVQRFNAIFEHLMDAYDEARDNPPPPPPHWATWHTLREMGGLDMEKSFTWIKKHGGCCDDVEVGLNVIGTWEEGPEAMEASEEAHSVSRGIIQTTTRRRMRPC